MGGNIPLDLALEHYNNTIKCILRTLGPNATNHKVVDRFCNAITVNKALLDNFDRSWKILKRSGKHVEANTLGDMKKVIGELVTSNAMKFTPGRKYEYFRDFKPSLLEDFDVHACMVGLKSIRNLCTCIKQDDKCVYSLPEISLS